MSPMYGPIDVQNALDLEANISKSNYVCTTQDCTFDSPSAALARDHLEENQSHEVVLTYTWG